MDIKKRLQATEDRLATEAESLAGLLEQLRSRISPALIAGAGWESLLECASDLPATLAAYPFGFELLLHEREPCADFGVSLVAGSRSGQSFQEMGSGAAADPVAVEIARLLREKARSESPLRRITGSKMLLEYDIDRSGRSCHPAPAVFLYPTEQPFYGRQAQERRADLGVVLDGISATGWDWDADERSHVERLYTALPPAGYILSMGAFPGRARGMRFTVAGFETAAAVMAYLQRTDWPGQHSAGAAALAGLQAQDSFGRVALHLDITPSSTRPKLGLSVCGPGTGWLPEDLRWLDKPADWTAFLESMLEQGLARPEKLAALAKWSSGAEMLFGRLDNFLLMRRIHHVKLVVAEDGIEQVKAYIFPLLLSLP
ncbi:MAG: hypothetical protein OXD30_07660 [Bryobacterales bacterium]|nr:hypothetical protein [Bryobacterales bacterium]